LGLQLLTRVWKRTARDGENKILQPIRIHHIRKKTPNYQQQMGCGSQCHDSYNFIGLAIQSTHTFGGESSRSFVALLPLRVETTSQLHTKSCKNIDQLINAEG